MFKSTRIKIKRIVASVGLLSAEVIIVTTVFFIALLVFSFLVKEIFYAQNDSFDQKAFSFMGSYVTAANTKFMRAMTFLGTHYFLIPVNLILAAYFFLVSRHKWYSVKIIAIALSTTAMMFLLKFIFSRDRPILPLLKPALGYSFPSGHSLVSFAFYGLLIHIAFHYIRNKYLKWTLIIFFAALILFIGLSRIYLRVHYASDVLAGFAIGVVWLMSSLFILRRIERYSKKELEPVVEEIPEKFT